MQLRTFLAKDMREALANVRTEMGPEAVIVASERAKGGGIVVRAALDEPETNVEEPQAESAVTTEAAPSAYETSYRDGLIRRLREPAQATHAHGAELRSRRNFSRFCGAIAPRMLSHTNSPKRRRNPC